MHKASRSIEKVPYYFFRSSAKFQGHNGRKIDYLNQILSKITRLLADVKSLRFDLFLLYFHIIMHSFLYFLRHDTIFPAHSPTGGLEFSNENIQQHCGKSGHPVFSNYVYQHWFHFLCKWNTVECITFIYFCHRCCNNDSRPDTAPGGGRKWASPNLQVWNKLVASIWKLTHRGLNKWPTLSRWHFQMKFPHENVSILILISLRVEESTWMSLPWFR